MSLLRLLHSLVTLELLPPSGGDTLLPPEPILALVQPPAGHPPGRALDLGCGHGGMAIYLAQLGWHATGVDLSRQAVKTARRRAGAVGVEVDFVVGDVTRLRSVVAESYDLAFDQACFLNLSFQDQGRYADELAHVLRSGATCLILTLEPGLLREGIGTRWCPASPHVIDVFGRWFEHQFAVGVDMCRTPAAFHVLKRTARGEPPARSPAPPHPHGDDSAGRLERRRR